MSVGSIKVMSVGGIKVLRSVGGGAHQPVTILV